MRRYLRKRGSNKTKINEGKRKARKFKLSEKEELQLLAQTQTWKPREACPSLRTT